jgi:hypothetical protein
MPGSRVRVPPLLLIYNDLAHSVTGCVFVGTIHGTKAARILEADLRSVAAEAKKSGEPLARRCFLFALCCPRDNDGPFTVRIAVATLSA